MSEKPKIKLSELAELYDIEDDKVEKVIEEQSKKENDYEIDIKEADEKLEEEINDGSW